jgi:preprotein translocase subunit SecA
LPKITAAAACATGCRTSIRSRCSRSSSSDCRTTKRSPSSFRRFQTQIDPESFRGKSRNDIQVILTECSRNFYRNGEPLEKVGEFLDRAYGRRNGADTLAARVREPEPIRELVAWAHDELKSSVAAEELLPLPRDEAEKKLAQEVELRYRPELREAERQLVLEVLDTAWKDHLYYMDHLRQGIGLVGYAQKDPKVEYKREGMKAFEGMWKGIGQQVTGSIFRMEKESPGFVGSLWQITATTHESPASNLVAEGTSGDANQPAGAPPDDKPIEPIRNRGDRVGRNDPCPCGSGKKFKNCHMKR